MMETSGRVMSCCVALFLTLTSVSAVQRIHSINDLKKINFGQTVPKHSLVLLHWFANTIDMVNTNVIRLNFDPDGDYGAHRYGNYEELLDPLPRGYQYYTVGNLNQDTLRSLPSYVFNPPRREYHGSNRDRIIIRVREQRIDQVYLTQHYLHQNTYDPDQTYQITANLLRQIREFALGGNHQRLLYLRNRFGSDADVFQIIQTWGDLACLGLLLFIVIQENDSFDQHNRPKNNNTQVNNNRPKNNDSRGNNNRPENRQDHGGVVEARSTYKSIGNRESVAYYASEQLDNDDESFCMICSALIVLIILCTLVAILMRSLSLS